MEVTTFYLNRLVDESGMGGLGKVSEGVILPNGTAIMWWLKPPHSVQIYKSIEDLHHIHRHGSRNTTELIISSERPSESSKATWEERYRKFLESGEPSICISDTQAKWIEGFIRSELGD